MTELARVVRNSGNFSFREFPSFLQVCEKRWHFIRLAEPILICMSNNYVLIVNRMYVLKV